MTRRRYNFYCKLSERVKVFIYAVSRSGTRPRRKTLVATSTPQGDSTAATEDTVFLPSPADASSDLSSQDDDDVDQQV